jgi:lipopolysaccharide export system ATP-binding protein
VSILATSRLGKRYQSRKVVDDVSLSVRTGEVAGLLGPNGAGKTTCFYMIVGLIPCAEGTITLDDIDLTLKPMHVRARHGLGYLPQEASIFRKMTVAENIQAVLEIRKGLDRQRRRELLESLMEELHVTHLRDQSGISLSGGERRRVEIARALAAEPRFILLDEPFAGVDPISVLDIQQIIKHLCNRNIGVLITDHNVRETLGICDHAYILNKGQVIAEGPPQAILENQQVRNVYLGAEFRL